MLLWTLNSLKGCLATLEHAADAATPLELTSYNARTVIMSGLLSKADRNAVSVESASKRLGQSARQVTKAMSSDFCKFSYDREEDWPLPAGKCRRRVPYRAVGMVPCQLI